MKQSLKQAAKQGEKGACSILAKEVIRARKAVNKIRVAQAQMKSVEYNMSNQLGNYTKCPINSVITPNVQSAR